VVELGHARQGKGDGHERKRQQPEPERGLGTGAGELAAGVAAGGSDRAGASPIRVRHIGSHWALDTGHWTVSARSSFAGTPSVHYRLICLLVSR